MSGKRNRQGVGRNGANAIVEEGVGVEEAFGQGGDGGELVGFDENKDLGSGGKR